MSKEKEIDIRSIKSVKGTKSDKVFNKRIKGDKIIFEYFNEETYEKEFSYKQVTERITYTADQVKDFIEKGYMTVVAYEEVTEQEACNECKCAKLAKEERERLEYLEGYYEKTISLLKDYADRYGKAVEKDYNDHNKGLSVDYTLLSRRREGYELIRDFIRRLL